MAQYLPGVAEFVMSGTGIEVILGAVYVVSTIKTTVSSAKYAYSWVKWARGKRAHPPNIDKNNDAWQWIDSDDEFFIEKDI
jgi:hypothetical protein